MNPRDLHKKLAAARDLLIAHRFTLALPLYEKLARQCPGDAVIWMEFGNAASGAREFDRADVAWQKALELDPKNAELIGMIGHQYQALRLPDRAFACFALASAANPRAINPRISAAVLLEQRHRLTEARTAVEECLAIDPKDDQGRYFAAVLDRREGKAGAAEHGLRDLIASEPRHPFVQYASRYELAQILDGTDRFDEAMRWLIEAKNLVRTLTDTDMLVRAYDKDAEGVLRFTRSLSKSSPTGWDALFPKAKRELIPPLAFLGGHPRSGTTLMEQVLGTHPMVAALDEPTAFLDVLQPAFFKSKDHSSARLNSIRRLYVQALEREAGPGGAGRVLLDKNPSPTTRLAVWLRVFPELKVLIALRDPRDVVISCYFQNVPLNMMNVNFLSLPRVVKHYSDLMEVWLTVREWQGFSWMETRYEDMVKDLEKEGRRATEFIGLGWHPEQARFYEKSRTKQLYSPTYQDVTRPVYARAVARWRAYEKHLDPVLPALEPYCRAFGY